MMEGKIERHVRRQTFSVVTFPCVTYLFVFNGMGPIILTVRMIWQVVRLIIMKKGHHPRLIYKPVYILGKSEPVYTRRI